MKYELMALVNAMAKQEKFPELAEEYEKIYNEINANRHLANPVDLGNYLAKTIDNYFIQIHGVTIEQEPEKQDMIEYQKPFFIDTSEFKKEEKFEFPSRLNEFINDLMRILNISEPRNKYVDQEKHKMALIMNEIRRLRQENNHMSWQINPDRMGK